MVGEYGGAKRSGRRLQKIWNRLEPYIFIAPCILMIFAFNFYTFFYGARLSLTDAQGINPGEFIGLANFKELLTTDPDFWPSIRRTILFTLGCLFTQIPVAFILAVILNGITSRLRGLLRASFYVPVLINTVVAALIFRMLFNRDTGMINWFLGLLGLPNQTNWLFESRFSLWLMVAVAFWQWMGYHMVYLLASLQAIDPTLYEVARIDGASPLRTMFSITLPLLRPAFTFVFITSAIGGMQVFDLPFMLFPNAGYGPGKAAMTAVPFIYHTGFSSQFRFGLSAAGGWLLFLLILGISILQLRVLRLGQADEM
ncbi:MAG: carbohydrate ABC transporter permease [Bacillota bacterium]